MGDLVKSYNTVYSTVVRPLFHVEPLDVLQPKLRVLKEQARDQS